MRPLGKARDGEAHHALTLDIGTVGVVAVQVVAEGGIVVDGQRDVVPDAAAGDVDSRGVADVRHEEGRLVRLVALAPSAVVEVEQADVRADGVAFDLGGGAAHGIATVGAVCLALLRGVVGVEAHFPVAIGVRDVGRDGEAERELAIGDDGVTPVDGVRVIGVGVGVARAVVVERGDLFLAVEDDGRQGAVEIREPRAVQSDHLALDRHSVEGPEVHRPLGGGLAVDLCHTDAVGGEGERQGRVADEDEAAVEVRQVAVFHPHQCLPQGGPTTVRAAFEKLLEEDAIHIEIRLIVGHARGGDQRNAATLLVEEDILSGRGDRMIEGREIARSRDPERQVGVGILLDHALGDDVLIAQGLGVTVAIVVDQHGAFALQVPEGGDHVGVGAAAASARAALLISVEKESVVDVLRVILLHELREAVGVAHVARLVAVGGVAVVADEAEIVFPGAEGGVIDVADDLVDGRARLADCADGESADAESQVAGADASSLAVVQKTEVIIRHKGLVLLAAARPIAT